MPTPPQPMTATDEPASTSAVLMAAPRPVVTPQPISAAMSNGTSSGIGTAQSGVDDDLLGEGAGAGEAEDIAAGALEVGGARVHEARQAQLGLAALAGRTDPAGGQPAQQYPVALLDAGDSVADVDDLAGALVTGDERRGLRQHAVHRGQVGVAQPGGPDADPDLAGPEAHRLDVVEYLELVLPCLVQYGCAHGAAPLVRVVPGQSCSTTVSASTGASSLSTAVTDTRTRARPRRSATS